MSTPTFTAAEQRKFDQALFNDLDQRSYQELTTPEIDQLSIAVYVAPISEIGNSQRAKAIQDLTLSEARKLRGEINAEIRRMSESMTMLQKADKAIRDALLGEAS